MNNKTNNKLKFLFISSDKFPPFRVDVAVLFGKELSKRGHQIDYLLQSEDDYRKFNRTQWLGARVFLGATDNGSSIFNRSIKHCLSLINDLRMVKLIKNEKYDFIQVKDKFVTAIIALILSKLAKCKFFFWLSYPFPEADIYNYETGTARYPVLYFVRGKIIKYILYKIILSYSNHVFVQSDQMKKDVCSMGIKANKITPVPMGVDIDDYSEIDEKNHMLDKEKNPSIVYIGEMEKARRIDFVLRVYKKVLEIVPTAKLYMVGGSSNLKDIELLKKEAELLNVHKTTKFTGFLPRIQALKCVKMATVCVSPIFPNPIYIPSSPTKIIEYMLMGKPVVANDIPDQRKIIKESRAGYCVNYDEDAFAKAVIALMKNPEEAKKMGSRGQLYVKRNRNYKEIANIVENQYFKLLF